MSNTQPDSVFSQEHSQGVVVVTINRPDQRNALNLEVKRRIGALISALDENPSVRVIVMVGAGGGFVAGTDIDEMISMTPTEHTRLRTDSMFVALRRCTKPLIAAVEGYALGGGCELALTCDLIVAGESARFGQPEICVGVMPGAGATQRFLKTIGRYQTMLLLLTGMQISGKQALSLRLVSEVTADGQALARALELAQTVSTMPPLAVRAIKELVQVGGDAPLESALLLERKSFQLLFDSEDQKEGMRAFREKRSPRFTGR